jgi:predicted nucleotidyltransferase
MLRVMTLDSTKDLELTERLVIQGLQDRPVQIWLFGSRAWGGSRRSSDIDVGILPLSPLQPGSLTDLQEELDRSLVLPRVELFDLTKVDSALRDKVMREGIAWQT